MPPPPKIKATIGEWIAEQEQDKRTSEKVARRMRRIRPQSKRAGSASRRDPLADHDIFQQIQASLHKGCVTILASGRKPPVRRWEDKIYRKTTDRNDETGQETRTIWTPDWDHTGDKLKLLAMAASMTGEPLSFTLRLGPKEIETALASPRGFVGYFTERMNREFRAAGDPAVQYAFILEASPVHELHIHGVISSSLDKVRPVLSRVGGGAKLMKAPERQAHTKAIDRLVGWTRYISKAPFVTGDTLSEARRKRGLADRRDQIIGAPRATRASAKAWYVAQRRSGLPLPATLGRTHPIETSLLDRALSKSR